MIPAIDPIVPWPVIAAVAALIVFLTAWAYAKRLRGTSGAWRWFAFGLRMLAVLLCVLACLRPSLLLQKKEQQASAVVFLSDSSKSMTIQDMLNPKERWRSARVTLGEGLAAAKGLGKNIVTKAFRFDVDVRDDKLDDTAAPSGRETALGSALEEVLKRMGGTRILSIVVLSDGSSNAGRPPLSIAAQRLKTQGVPVVAVPFGAETAGEGSKDVSVRAMVAGPTVYVKNELNVGGTISARGYPGQELDVELVSEGAPVAKTKICVPERGTEVPVTGLRWVPAKAGETKLTLRVKEQPGELVKANNEYSTFVTVLGGGLNVLYLTGPGNVWEARFLFRVLAQSQKIQLTLKQLRKPAGPELDPDFAQGAFDVYIVGDLPAEFLTPSQKELLARRVQSGAGLIMLGGRGSFGSGGWAGTPVGEILPTQIRATDGQIEPAEGFKMVASPLGLDSYVLRLARDRAESKRQWDALPPIAGSNRLGPEKAGAVVWGTTPEGEALMVGQDAGRGRVMAFGGETWSWARADEESRLAHLKFWRQAILWLAHKEDDDDGQVRLALDRRRVEVGGRVEMTVVARDSKGEPIPGLKYETTITRDAPGAAPEKADVVSQGAEAKGAYFVTGQPGDYKVTVNAVDPAGKPVGSDTARFLAFQDDRELENPAADTSLLRQIAEATGGKTVPPEGLAKHIASLDKSLVSEYVTQREVRVWDNWWFLVLFACLLTFEWWLRKRHGWV